MALTQIRDKQVRILRAAGGADLIGGAAIGEHAKLLLAFKLQQVGE